MEIGKSIELNKLVKYIFILVSTIIIIIIVVSIINTLRGTPLG